MLRATTTSPLLATFNEAGILDPADIHVGRRLAVMVGDQNPQMWLAGAFAVRALRAGSSCLDLATLSTSNFDLDEELVDVSHLPWPEPTSWLEAVTASPAVTNGPLPAQGTRPFRLVDGLLYLERYWGYQDATRRLLLGRLADPGAILDPADHTALLDELFPREGLRPDEPDLQRRAAELAMTSRVSVLAGGPGTGKTTTVAKILTALAVASPTPLRMALAAPTGKAAVRLTESLRAQLPHLPASAAQHLAGLEATTVHGLLGWIPDSTVRFLHDESNPVPFDVVVIDEVSMLALVMMTRVLEALPPTCRLILVGDPDQLASVEVGAVLADIVEGLPSGVVELQRSWRFDDSIGVVARAVRHGQAEEAVRLTLAEGAEVTLIDVDPVSPDLEQLSALRNHVVRQGSALWRHAHAGDAEQALRAMDSHRLLCAHRTGLYGVAWWSGHVERWLKQAIPGYGIDGEWYVGRPVLITTNLHDLGLMNGDSGVVIATDDGPRVAFRRGEQITTFAPGHIDEVQTLHAMTVHKSQGSQFTAVSMILPPPNSPLMTRELLYTGITRASRHVDLYGLQESLSSAVGRPAARASGLAGALRVPLAQTSSV